MLNIDGKDWWQIIVVFLVKFAPFNNYLQGSSEVHLFILISLHTTLIVTSEAPSLILGIELLFNFENKY